MTKKSSLSHQCFSTPELLFREENKMKFYCVTKTVFEIFARSLSSVPIFDVEIHHFPKYLTGDFFFKLMTK